jgi:glycosyltransferase involved in cell wall biosynthesis
MGPLIHGFIPKNIRGGPSFGFFVYNDISSKAPPRNSLPKIVAVLPIFNEEKHLGSVLRKLKPSVDFLVCVNDGSSDGSREILQQFGKKNRSLFLVDLTLNTGMAGALKQGFLFVLYLRQKGILKDNDVVVTLDADGQHKPEYIPGLVRYMIRKKVEVLLTRRDFSVYPRYKIWGNRFLTFTNSILSGHPYHDVESGLRLLQVHTLPTILSFYTGIKYSCAQEIALITARAGFRIDNQFQVKIAYYRAGTTIWDGFIVLTLSLWCFTRMLGGVRESFDIQNSVNAKAFAASKKTEKR